jgi:hypothetical protein
VERNVRGDHDITLYAYHQQVLQAIVPSAFYHPTTVCIDALDIVIERERNIREITTVSETINLFEKFLVGANNSRYRAIWYFHPCDVLAFSLIIEKDEKVFSLGCF